MIWALVATLGVFKTAQLQLSPSGTGLRGAAASFRRRATIAGDHESRALFEADTARRATAAGGFAAAPFDRRTSAARGDGGARRLRRGLIAADDNWLEDYCWSFDRRNQCNNDPCCEWDGYRT